MEYYDIIVKGHLGDKRLGYFDGFDATLLPTGETLLVGPVTDQAALHGVLRRIGELNLPLMLVKVKSREEVLSN
jgi:hypothetical protein